MTVVYECVGCTVCSGRVVLCRTCATARLWVRIPPAAAAHQCQLSVPSLRGRLMSNSKSWGVNGHTTWCTSLVSMVLWLRLESGWGLVNGDQRRLMGLWGSGKDFTFLLSVRMYRELSDIEVEYWQAIRNWLHIGTQKRSHWSQIA